MTCQAVSSTSFNQDCQEKNNLRNSDDITFMAENKEELKSLLMKGEKAGLKLNRQNTKVMDLVSSLHGK